MKQSNTSRYAYLAGLIDGEGTIAIKKRDRHNGKSEQYELYISLNQKDGKMIDWLYGTFGGMVRWSNSIQMYNWWIQNRKAFEILKRILPFLTYKKKQAEIGIRFGHRIKPQTRLSEEELQKREELKQLLHQQKKIFQKSAVVETKRGASSKEDKQ